MARAIDADAVKRRAWDIAEAWKDQGRDYEALLLESVVEQFEKSFPAWRDGKAELVEYVTTIGMGGRRVGTGYRNRRNRRPTPTASGP